jgi:hypothetical protein
MEINRMAENKGKLLEETTKELADRNFELTPYPVLLKGKRNVIQGKSGYFHQIDVSGKHGNNLVLVECKDWEIKIPVEPILALFARVYDIQAVFGEKITVIGVMVSPKGYTAGAEILANYFGTTFWWVTKTPEFGMKLDNLIALGVEDKIRVRDSDPIVKIMPPNESA